MSLEKWSCVDFDKINILRGNFDGNFVYMVNIQIRQCQNSTFNGNSCLPYEKIQNNFQNNITGLNLFFSFLYLEMVPTMSDYNTPLRTSLKNSYELLSLQVTKSKVKIFKEIKLAKDNGWIFASIDDLSVYSTESLVNDFSFKDPKNEYTPFYDFGKDYRNYTKFKKFLNKLGEFVISSIS